MTARGRMTRGMIAMRLVAQAAAVMALMLVLAAPAMALDLEEAKQAGLVGERYDGYIAAVKPSPAADVRALIEHINEARRTRYQEIARKNGTSLAAVAAIAGKKLVEGAPPGTYVMDKSGTWIRK
jgi:uncharacterized protein YdbL (DUF1318 family)